MEFRCPICRRSTDPKGEEFPFCSKRCKLIDLGSWLDERYRISRPLKANDSGGPSTLAGDGFSSHDPARSAGASARLGESDEIVR